MFFSFLAMGVCRFVLARSSSAMNQGLTQHVLHVAFHVASICRISAKTVGNANIPVATQPQHEASANVT